jgi:enoyl-CoA hydratase/carnithine racemase
MGILVDYSVENGVAVIALNDPPANTYTYEMNKELDTAILEARMDDSVHVIVLRGAGDKFFSAGANIKMLSEVTPGFKYYFCLHANETLSRLEQTPKLVIAAINGHCVGGGLEIAMAADMRIAKKGAGKMGLPEVSLGVLPGTGGTQRLSRIVGKSKSIELMIEGGLFELEDALEMGIINYLWPAEEDGKAWWDRVMDYARSFCPPNKASRAVGRIKRSVQSGWELPFESALTLERELQQQLFQSSDAKEGLNAYVTKRTPKFEGK